MLFRLVVAGHILGCVDVREELENLREADDTISDRLTFSREHDEWRACAYAYPTLTTHDPKPAPTGGLFRASHPPIWHFTVGR